MKSGDVKKLQNKIQEIFPNSDKLFGKRDKVEKGNVEDGTTLIFINGELVLFEIGEQLIPFLRILLKNLIQLPKIVVDKGAIPFITRGATVMKPGIVAADDSIKKGDYVVIVDENHNKALAVGLALIDASEISKEKKGKAIKTIHYIGDKMWDFGKRFDGK